jgi:hypothetical protein
MWKVSPQNRSTFWNRAGCDWRGGHLGVSTGADCAFNGLADPGNQQPGAPLGARQFWLVQIRLALYAERHGITCRLDSSFGGETGWRPGAFSFRAADPHHTILGWSYPHVCRDQLRRCMAHRTRLHRLVNGPDRVATPHPGRKILVCLKKDSRGIFNCPVEIYEDRIILSSSLAIPKYFSWTPSPVSSCSTCSKPSKICSCCSRGITWFAIGKRTLSSF